MPLAAQVAVNDAAFHYDKCYTYSIPPQLADTVHAGSLVLVPFGRASAPRMGVVLEVGSPEALPPRCKALWDAAPEGAALTPALLRLVQMLREHTFCTYYEAVKTVLPYGALYRVQHTPEGPRLQQQLARRTQRWYALAAPAPPASSEPTEPSAPPARRPSEKQQAVLAALAAGPKEESALLADCGVGRGVLDNLVKKGLLTLEKRDSPPPPAAPAGPKEAIVLSDEQAAVCEGLTALLQSGRPQAALLHGVTSSGKTLVFLQLLAQTVAMGRQAIVLVPEISLTPQMIARIQRQFGDRVAVQHSALSHTERLQQWQQIHAGKVDVVVGTRSAVFAPLARLGLVIIDEEQEHTYRSEQSPRYLAHDVARFRAGQENALLLLASATPSLESYYAAEQGRYHLFRLKNRYGGLPLPKVELVDTREELLKGNPGLLSMPLTDAVCQCLQEEKQAILLLNRRGYQTVGLCTRCAKVLKCTSCSVPMVYHKTQNKLMCHHCGRTLTPQPTVCPDCGGAIRYTGYGTQRIEEELAQKFPSARILRMDMDTTGKKDAHRQMLTDFAAHRYDVLIGTQMVAKGLDFPRVSLVGVIGVDALLFNQGYRAFEEVFSLVTQVVGRSGRAGGQGQALIQTVDVNHPILNLAAAQDYAAFYADEIQFRRLNLYPPFCSLCMIGFQAAREEDARSGAAAFSELLQQNARRAPQLPLRILGPSPYHIVMVNDHYRYKLTLKCRNDTAFRNLLRETAQAFCALPLAAKISLSFDFHADDN